MKDECINAYKKRKNFSQTVDSSQEMSTFDKTMHTHEEELSFDIHSTTLGGLPTTARTGYDIDAQGRQPDEPAH
jgi:hypothetical protein